MSRVLDLAGDDWGMREALGDTWQWFVRPTAGANNAAAAAAAVDRDAGWLPARVPGSVVADLVRAGELRDPNVERRSREAEWAADRSWVHRRIVRLPPGSEDGLALLELDGVDPGGPVFWDGEEVGRADGLYRRLVIDLARRATAGRHVLAVVVEPAPPSEPQVGRTDRVRVHAPRMPYGWDFSPRLRHQGIWRGARIRTGAALLTDLVVRTVYDHAERRGSVLVQASVRTLGQPVVLTARLGPEAVRAEPDEAGRVRLQLHLHDPAPWSVHGRGAQALHELVVAVEDPAAGPEAPPLDVAVRRIGFRDLDWAPNRGAPADALPYTAVLNGEPLPLIGWNWVPADLLLGATDPALVRHLVRLAAQSGARLLRVWGGGLIETETFYDACDEAGLLVWQEFSQSSSGVASAPSEDVAFVARMAEEAAAVVPPLGRHPSLALWGGGNELERDGVPLDERTSPVLAALREAVRRLDPGRHWLPTSPSGPAFFFRGSSGGREHDVHGPWEHQGLEDHAGLADAGTALAHSEFGVEGMTNRRAHESVLPSPGDRWPADRRNPVYRHLGDWWNNAELVQRAFGGRLGALEPLRRASQLLQATGLQYAVEADRRRWPRCSLVLPWQLDESFPNAWCTATVDHLGDPKPAYFAVARAFRPERVTLRTRTTAWGGRAPRAEAWLWSERGVAAGSRVVLRLLDERGAPLAEAAAVVGRVREPRAAVVLEGAGAPAGAVVAWSAEWIGADGRVLDSEASVATTADDLVPLLELPPPRLDVSVAADGGSVRVVHAGGPLAVTVRLVDARPAQAAGRSVLGGDPRPLLPGEERGLPVDRGDTAGPLPLLLEAWNAIDVPLEVPAGGCVDAGTPRAR